VKIKPGDEADDKNEVTKFCHLPRRRVLFSPPRHTPPAGRVAFF